MSSDETAAGVRPGSVQAEIRQRVPFRSRAEEAAVTLMRTASVVARAMARVIEPEGVSVAQYNVLRILRGAGKSGMPTLSIRDRMIEEGASITRLLDKLEETGYVRRERCRPDRRQVIAYLTDAGAALLDRLDPAVHAANQRVMGVLGEAETTALLSLLDQVRAATRSDAGE
ncbi:MAG TPA: MarR family transcriptional regulator [Longimicrobium sp.]|nr:MarR family transcriptional regulator [Longimicrobium sp.]